MIKHVLVGVDFSEASRVALTQGYGWAQRLGVPIRVLHVLQPPAPLLPEAQIALPDSEWLEALEAHALEQLQKWVADLPGVSMAVKWGSPAEELVAEADADTLLVVSQVGHSGIERLLFGSTAARVVRHAPCDVLVVRGPASAKR
jgi:nucleotide-binding universal stress UspA family protein